MKIQLCAVDVVADRFINQFLSSQDTVDILGDNVKQMLCRNETLDVVIYKSEELANESRRFTEANALFYPATTTSDKC